MTRKRHCSRLTVLWVLRARVYTTSTCRHKRTTQSIVSAVDAFLEVRTSKTGLRKFVLHRLWTCIGRANYVCLSYVGERRKLCVARSVRTFVVIERNSFKKTRVPAVNPVMVIFVITIGLENKKITSSFHVHTIGVFRKWIIGKKISRF